MIKNFILNLTFVKEAIRQEGIKAFKLAEKDVLEILPDNYFNDKVDEAVKEKLLQLLSPIDWSYVIKKDARTKQVYIGDEIIDPGTLANLKAEADFLTESTIWKLLYETPKAEAQNSMFVKGETLHDMVKGKSMLYALDQQKTIINYFKK